jgi:hypothetical protein
MHEGRQPGRFQTESSWDQRLIVKILQLHGRMAAERNNVHRLDDRNPDVAA